MFAALYATDVWKEELLDDGFVIVYTDGACSHNKDPRLRRAGYGAFWALNHPLNISLPLAGNVQTNQRAELQT
eukprot:8795099-Karenia_brevis.AAC.1